MSKAIREVANLTERKNLHSPVHLTVSRPQALFGRTRLGKTGFQIEESDLIQGINEDRLRLASGPVHYHPICYIDSPANWNKIKDVH